MAFAKAKAEQAYLKMSMYGPPGSGKTFTALLLAEGLGKAIGKRVAVVDTERGTDFYSQAVPSRATHPDAFDFDALYSRSLVEVLREVKALNPATHGVIIIDSISHLWEAAMAAYTGKKTRLGGIPMHAWSSIKKPYKDLMAFLVNSPFHCLILGRQANEFGDDEETGETRATGVKMKAEGETQYEPHICIRMEAVKPSKKVKTAVAVPTAFAEKDRSGILQGRLIEWPDFASLAEPLLPHLGNKQAKLLTEEEVAMLDSEAMELERAQRSHDKRREIEARLGLASTEREVIALGRSIAAISDKMLSTDVDNLRSTYALALARAREQPVDPDGDAERKAIEQGQ